MTDQREAVARAIYEHYLFGKEMDPVPSNGKPAWIEGGNSDAQDIARRLADAAIAAMGITDETVVGRSEDTARLDFLDGLNVRLNEHYGTTYNWELVMNHNVNRLSLAFPMIDLNDMAARGLKSCRDAIDKARRSAPPAAAQEGE